MHIVGSILSPHFLLNQFRLREATRPLTPYNITKCDGGGTLYTTDMAAGSACHLPPCHVLVTTTTV